MCAFEKYIQTSITHFFHTPNFDTAKETHVGTKFLHFLFLFELGFCASDHLHRYIFEQRTHWTEWNTHGKCGQYEIYKKSSPAIIKTKMYQ